MTYEEEAYRIVNLLEVHFYRAHVQIRVGGRIMNELGKLALAHFVGSVSENEQEGVDNI